MPIFNLSNPKRFINSFHKLPPASQLFAICCLLLAILYPGQNYYQTLTIHPGPVVDYSFPAPTLADYPVGDETRPPYTSASAVIIQDIASKSIIYSYGEDSPLMPASTTKLMTALVALDYYSPEDILTVQNEDRAIGSSIDLVSGESITVKNLLYGLLVGSGNDAALALADNYQGGYQGFVDAMNAKATELHLDNTSYRNPSGVENYAHTTSARDLAVLASYVLSKPLLVEIINTKQVTITDSSGEIIHNLVNTNELLGELEGVQGMKTGWTENAGECLVTYVERAGRGVIIVVLGSQDRFGETESLVDWIYAHHNWVNPE